MPAFNASHRPRALISWTSIPAAIATVVLLLAGIFADYQNRVVSNQALRADVTSEVNLIRAKLEGNINSNIQLVRGLVATIATEPGMKQPRFAELAENLLSRGDPAQKHRRRAWPRHIADVSNGGKREGVGAGLPNR